MDVGLLKQYAAEGLTRSEIAAKLGKSYNRITEAIRENGIDVPRKKRVVTKHTKRGPRSQTLRILEMRKSGKQRKEIAKELGCCLDTVSSALKNYGMTHPYETVTEDQAISIISRAGYDYVSGFFNTHSKVLIKCRQCGGEYERMYAIIRKQLEGKYPNEPECPYCKRREVNRREREEHERIEREARIKAEQRARREADLISRQTEERLAIHVCKNCGVEYCMAVTGYNSKQYCSEKCMKRYVMRIKNDRRLKRMKSRICDTDITLEKLFKRDDGVCYICGNKCSWDDVQDGNAGNTYPSIDHVRPISKGGTHTWGNVKLACRLCNTLKGDGDNPR